MEKQLTDYKIDDIVPVFHFGRPGQMKVIGYDEETNQVRVQHLEAMGNCYYTPARLEEMKEECDNYNTANCSHEFVGGEYLSQPYGTCLSCGRTIIK